MAVGAYASAVLTQKFGVPFIVSVPVAGLIAGVVGVVVGFPALRIKGIYLLLLTLGFAEIIQVIALSWDYVGGAQGYRNIPFNRRTLESVIVVVALLILFFGRLERSSLGRAMDSIHQDETAAEVMGIDVVRIKLLAFGLGATIAGIAGALYAHQATYIDSTTFNIMMAVEILTFVVVGGGSTYWGPVVGATVSHSAAGIPAHAARMARAAAGVVDELLPGEPGLRFPARVPRFRERQAADRLRHHPDRDDDRAAGRPDHARLAAPAVSALEGAPCLRRVLRSKG